MPSSPRLYACDSLLSSRHSPSHIWLQCKGAYRALQLGACIPRGCGCCFGQHGIVLAHNSRKAAVTGHACHAWPPWTSPSTLHCRLKSGAATLLCTAAQVRRSDSATTYAGCAACCDSAHNLMFALLLGQHHAQFFTTQQRPVSCQYGHAGTDPCNGTCQERGV